MTKRSKPQVKLETFVNPNHFHIETIQVQAIRQIQVMSNMRHHEAENILEVPDMDRVDLKDVGLWPSKIDSNTRILLVRQGASKIQSIDSTFGEVTEVVRQGASTKGQTRHLTHGFDKWWKLNPKIYQYESNAHHLQNFTKWKELEIRIALGATIDNFVCRKR